MLWYKVLFSLTRSYFTLIVSEYVFQVCPRPGSANVADPLGGSWLIESLTDQLEQEAEKYFEEIVFIDTNHINKYSAQYKNDKLLILIKK